MREIRISIATIVSILICVGIVMIYSSSGIFAMQEQGDSLYFLKRHLVFLFAGIGLSVLAMAVDYRLLQKYAKPLRGLLVDWHLNLQAALKVHKRVKVQ